SDELVATNRHPDAAEADPQPGARRWPNGNRGDDRIPGRIDFRDVVLRLVRDPDGSGSDRYPIRTSGNGQLRFDLERLDWTLYRREVEVNRGAHAHARLLTIDDEIVVHVAVQHVAHGLAGGVPRLQVHGAKWQRMLVGLERRADGIELRGSALHLDMT